MSNTTSNQEMSIDFNNILQQAKKNYGGSREV